MSIGILSRQVIDLPIAVIDFETTGLSPEQDRAVELSIVRVEPGGRDPALVFDSLINPGCSVGATYVHGITNRMVAQAPSFEDLWPAIRTSLSGCVIAAYNAYFDMKFLECEAKRCGDAVAVPFFCLMYMRSLLDIGRRCSLDEACAHHGVKLRNAHRAARDAMATAQLLPHYLAAMRSKRIDTFADLKRTGEHRYLSSFNHRPLETPELKAAIRVHPREMAM